METVLPDGAPVGAVLIYLAIGGIVTLGGSFIINIWKTKIEAKKEVDIKGIDHKQVEMDLISENLRKEIERKKQEKAEALESLAKALTAMKEMKLVIKDKDTLIEKIERKFEAVKVAFRLTLVHYKKELKDEPESLMMLEELNSIIDE